MYCATPGAPRYQSSAVRRSPAALRQPRRWLTGHPRRVKSYRRDAARFECGSRALVTLIADVAFINPRKKRQMRDDP